MRALNGSISDWSYLYRQAFHALRPDGYLEHFEFDILLRSDDPLVDSEHVFTQWAETLHYASEKMGRTLKTVKDGRMRRSMKEAGFVDIVEKKFDVPIGGWSADPKMRQAGLYALMYLDLSLEGLALFPLKQVLGWEPDQIQDFVARMRAALRDSNLKPYHQGYVILKKYQFQPAPMLSVVIDWCPTRPVFFLWVADLDCFKNTRLGAKAIRQG